MHCLSFALCLASALSSILYPSIVLPTPGSVIVIAASQCLVFLVIAKFAHLCRDNAYGSGIVLAMAVLATLLSAFVMWVLSSPPGFGVAIIVVWCLYAQAITAVLGCYAGYAFVENRRLKYHASNHASGKVIVVLLLTTAVLAYASLVALGST